MKELLEHVAKKILPHSEDVFVTEDTDEHGDVHLTLTTNPEDIGLAIGKGGKTAHALRELLKIVAVQQKVKVFLKIRSSDEVEEETTSESSNS